MKRKHKEKYHSLYRCNPWFFWKKCCQCGDDFRRERGYRAMEGPYYAGVGNWVYLCQSCGPSIDDAHQYFLKEKWKRHIIDTTPPTPPVNPTRNG